jgi:hypothetical protein
MFLFDFSAIYPLCEDHSSNMAAELLGNHLEVMNAFFGMPLLSFNSPLIYPS